MGVPDNEQIKIAPCREACPAGIDVPRYIRYIRNGDFDEALAVIRERIPFAAVCGYACAHPCESRCARIQYDEAVAIRRLKRAAATYSHRSPKSEETAKSTSKKVAVIGSGPCGLTAAYYLAELGHSVAIFEKLPKAGGMLRYGIPEYRLPKDIVDREIAFIKSRGVGIVTGTKVDSAAKLLSEGFDAVLAASGAWKAQKMGIEGEGLPTVVDGVKFLAEYNSGVRRPVGKRVVVVGGGNTAVDASLASVRMGAKVVLVYRRSREDMPALPEEIAQAEEEGVRIQCMAVPVQITKSRIVCIRTAPGPVDGSGRPRPVPVEGSEFALSCNAVVMAVGQSADAGALGLAGNGDGTIAAGADTATQNKGIFAAGDAATGPMTIINAIAQGRLACAAIDRFLGGKGRIGRDASPGAVPEPSEPEPMGTCRVEPGRIPLSARFQGVGPVEYSYSEKEAVEEAGRCLSCDVRRYEVEIDPVICKACGYCREMCHMDIFGVSDTFNAGGYKPSVVKRSDRCVGCLKCLYVCPDFAIKINDGCGGAAAV